MHIMTIKLAKKVIQIITVCAIMIIAVYIIYKLVIPSGQRGLKIDDSVILVEEVKKISQLFTAVYYDEIAIDTFKYQEKDIMGRVWNGFIAPRPGFRRAEPDYGFRRVELVVVARGKIMAGFDFSQIEPEDMIVENRSITFTLPPPQILEVIINPSDYEIFIEEGRWGLQEAVELKMRAAKVMENRAIERGILDRSESTAIRILQNYFTSLGFEEVTIRTESMDAFEPLRLSPSLE
jgi:hypothetical protein